MLSHEVFCRFRGMCKSLFSGVQKIRGMIQNVMLHHLHEEVYEMCRPGNTEETSDFYHNESALNQVESFLSRFSGSVRNNFTVNLWTITPSSCKKLLTCLTH